MMDREDWEDLVGKRIHSVENTAIGVVFTFDDGTKAEFETSAGCCSRSWIEHFDAPSDAVGSVFRGVEERDVDNFWAKERDEEYDEYNRGDIIKVYETVFLTDHGRITCEYRNASNGFYGGSLDRVRL